MKSVDCFYNSYAIDYFLDPEYCGYNIFLKIDIRGEISYQKLIDCINLEIRSSEALSCSFKIKDDGRIAQVFVNAPDADVIEVDVSSESEFYVNGFLNRISLRLARLPLRLDEGSVFKCVVIKISSVQAIVLFVAHQAIFDGTSGAIFIKNLVNNYFFKNPEINEGLMDGYSSVVERISGFYQDKLKVLKVPKSGLLIDQDDKLNPIKKVRHNITSIGFTISEANLRIIEDRCKNLKITKSILLMGIFSFIYSILTDKNLFNLGVPISTRDSLDKENLIGMFVRTQMVTIAIKDEESINEKALYFADSLYKAIEINDDPIHFNRSNNIDLIFNLQSGLNHYEYGNVHFCPRFDFPRSLFSDASITLFEFDNHIDGEIRFDSEVYKDIFNDGEFIENLIIEICKFPDVPISNLRAKYYNEDSIIPINNKIYCESKGYANTEVYSKIFTSVKHLWVDLLKIDNLVEDSNFFSMGGDSLLAINFVRKINRLLGTSYPISHLFEVRTLKLVVDYIVSIYDSSKLSKGDIKFNESISYPASGQQLAIYLNEAISNIGMHNILMKIELEKSFNPDVFRSTIDALIGKLDVFKSAFKIDKSGKLLCFISNNTSFYFEVHDFIFSKNEDFSQYDVINNFEFSEANYKFDLSQPSFIRVNIFKYSDSSYRLYLNVHHICYDQFSGKIFFDELWREYFDQLIGEGGKNIRRELGRYSEYALTQQELLNSQDGKINLGNFIDKISNSLFDMFQIKSRSKKGVKIDFNIDCEILKLIKHAASKQSVTEYSILLAAFGFSLSSWLGIYDKLLPVSCIVNNRIDPRFSNCIGLFSNVLPILLRSTDVDIANALNYTQQSIGELLEFSSIPFINVVEACSSINKSGYMLSQCVFGFHEKVRLLTEFHESDHQIEYVHDDSARFDFVINLYRSETDIDGYLECREDISNKFNITAFLEIFRANISLIVDDILSTV